MISLLLSIVFSTTLVVIFKIFDKLGVNNLHAIVVNYITAAIIGMLIMPFSVPHTFQTSWWFHTPILGILFISIFFVMALTTQRAGMAVTSVAGKMSMVIPVMVGILYFKEHLNTLQWFGLVTAVLAVLSISYRKEQVKLSVWVILLPFVLFIGSGFIDTYLNVAQKLLISEDEFVPFTSLVFLFAFISGAIFLTVQTISNRAVPSVKSIVGGIILGVFNWGSLFFLLRALRYTEFPSAVVFAFNNIGIVIASAITGILLFNEKYAWINYIGLFLSVLAIILLNGEY